MDELGLVWAGPGLTWHDGEDDADRYPGQEEQHTMLAGCDEGDRGAQEFARLAASAVWLIFWFACVRVCQPR